jgi:diadenosine tetraphosphate (Ap4A) HIT family hydrolase
MAPKINIKFEADHFATRHGLSAQARSELFKLVQAIHDKAKEEISVLRANKNNSNNS